MGIDTNTVGQVGLFGRGVRITKIEMERRKERERGIGNEIWRNHTDTVALKQK